MEEKKKTILIVEDDKNFLWLLEQGFTGEELSIFSASDGEEGLRLAEKEKPDLIIVDILLPKMDGITMAKKIKEKGINSHKIFLTNFSDEEHIENAIELDKKVDYIIKSDMHIAEIVKMVKDRLNIK
jgi:DNA-binding response OmpR family regulator